MKVCGLLPAGPSFRSAAKLRHLICFGLPLSAPLLLFALLDTSQGRRRRKGGDAAAGEGLGPELPGLKEKFLVLQQADKERRHLRPRAPMPWRDYG